MQEGWPGYRNPENFIVVSDAYPTVTAMAADLILPTAMWVEKEGAYGNAERRTQLLAPAGRRARRGALRPVAARRVLQALHHRGGLAGRAARQEAGVPGKTLYDVLFANGKVDSFPSARSTPATTTTKRSAFGFYVQKGLFEEYAAFGRGHGHDLAPFDTYHQVRGLRWPVVDGKETLWRYREGYDPYVRPAKGWQFYGHPTARRGDLRAALRAAGRESPDKESPVAVHRPRARALALRLDDPRACPSSTARSRTPSATCTPTTRSARRRRGDEVARRLAPRRDPVRASRPAGRNKPPRGARLRAVVRRQPADQQGHARRHRSDLQADRLQEVRRQDRPRCEAEGDMRRALKHRRLASQLPAAAPHGARGASLHRRGPPGASRPRPPPPIRRTTPTSAQRATIPMQPPVIPHKITGIPDRPQRQQVPDLPQPPRTEASQAPMIRVTHFQDREGNFLAAVSPRRYFCMPRPARRPRRAAGRQPVQGRRHA